MGILERLFGKKKEVDPRLQNWAKLVIEGYNPEMEVDEKMLLDLTEKLIERDVSIVLESLDISTMPNSVEDARRRVQLAKSRLSHLGLLEQFADAGQLSKIKMAQNAMEDFNKKLQVAKKKKDELLIKKKYVLIESEDEVKEMANHKVHKVDKG